MSGDYSILFEATNLYAKDSPVMLKRGRLYSHRRCGSVVELIFQNVSSRPIKTLSVDIKIYGKDAPDPVCRIYHRRNNPYQIGEEFGSDIEIPLYFRNPESFEVTDIRAVLDGGEQVCVPYFTHVLPEAIDLYDVFDDVQMIIQYEIDSGCPDAMVEPEKYMGLWRCSCGEWNSADECFSCHAQEVEVFFTFDESLLMKNMKARLKREQAEKKKREEQERLEAEERERQRVEKAQQEAREKASERARRRKRLGIVLALLVLIFVVVNGWNNILSPFLQYRKAEEHLRNHEYEEAIDIYFQLNDYKDSVDKRRQACIDRDHYAMYTDGVALFQDGRYKRAIFQFECSADYFDDSYNIDYYLGECYFQEQRYAEALTRFEQVTSGQFKEEAKARISEIQSMN